MTILEVLLVITINIGLCYSLTYSVYDNNEITISLLNEYLNNRIINNNKLHKSFLLLIRSCDGIENNNQCIESTSSKELEVIKKIADVIEWSGGPYAIDFFITTSSDIKNTMLANDDAIVINHTPFFDELSSIESHHNSNNKDEYSKLFLYLIDLPLAPQNIVPVDYYYIRHPLMMRALLDSSHNVKVTFKLPSTVKQPIELRWAHFRGNTKLASLGPINKEKGTNSPLLIHPGTEVVQYTRGGHLFAAMKVPDSIEYHTKPQSNVIRNININTKSTQENINKQHQTNTGFFDNLFNSKQPSNRQKDSTSGEFSEESKANNRDPYQDDYSVDEMYDNYAAYWDYLYGNASTTFEDNGDYRTDRSDYDANNDGYDDLYNNYSEEDMRYLENLLDDYYDNLASNTGFSNFREQSSNEADEADDLRGEMDVDACCECGECGGGIGAADHSNFYFGDPSIVDDGNSGMYGNQDFQRAVEFDRVVGLYMVPSITTILSSNPKSNDDELVYSFDEVSGYSSIEIIIDPSHKKAFNIDDLMASDDCIAAGIQPDSSDSIDKTVHNMKCFRSALFAYWEQQRLSQVSVYTWGVPVIIPQKYPDKEAVDLPTKDLYTIFNIPHELKNKLKKHHLRHRLDNAQESVNEPPISLVFNQHRVHTRYVPLWQEDLDTLTNFIHQKTAKWLGLEMEELLVTGSYGSREYSEGAVVRWHVDPVESQPITAIIHIAHYYGKSTNSTNISDSKVEADAASTVCVATTDGECTAWSIVGGSNETNNVLTAAAGLNTASNADRQEGWPIFLPKDLKSFQDYSPQFSNKENKDNDIDFRALEPIYLKEGQVLLLQSAKVPHARLLPLTSKRDSNNNDSAWYANTFVHLAPDGWFSRPAVQLLY